MTATVSGDASVAAGAVSERDAVRRLFQRVALGPRPGELEQAVAAGFDATLRSLLAPVADDRGVAATPPPSPPVTGPGLDDAGARRLQKRNESGQARTLMVWWLDRMAAVDAPLRERMTWFWHGHFATSYRGVHSGALMLQQNETQRRLGLGDFGSLARAMVVDPALLLWLNGDSNRRGRPNENLAREFMELFTLGVGSYTETDVREGARALTGWAVRFGTDTAVQVPANHDPGPETVLGRSSGFDAVGLADLLVGRPESGRFVARRLWVRMVGEAPPDPATLKRLVAAYGPGGDVTALLQAVLTAPAFRQRGSALVRSPVEWLVGALRALRLSASALPVAALAGGLAGMGQTPFDPASVGGWPSGPRWLTTSSALSRLQLAQALVAVGDLSAVADAAPRSRVEATVRLLGMPRLSGRTASALAPLVRQPPELVAAALVSPENVVSA